MLPLVLQGLPLSVVTVGAFEGNIGLGKLLSSKTVL